MKITGMRRFRRTAFLKTFFIVAALAIMPGCAKSDKIETYDVIVQKKNPAEGQAHEHAAHEHAAHANGMPSSMGAHQAKGERMLVGMLITSKGSWFFKLLG